MSFEISWYLPKRVLHIHLLAEQSLSDLEALSWQTAPMIEEGIAPVHVLLDDAKGGRPPISLKEIQSRLDIITHPSIGWVVGVGEVDAVAKFMVPLLMKIVKVSYVRVATIEEALVFLSKHDPQLQLTNS